MYIYIKHVHVCVTLPVVFYVSENVGLRQGDETDGEVMGRQVCVGVWVRS